LTASVEDAVAEGRRKKRQGSSGKCSGKIDVGKNVSGLADDARSEGDWTRHRRLNGKTKMNYGP
jgi:hypothetical protein